MDKYEILEKAYLDKLFIPGTDGCPRNKLGLSDKSLLKKFESQYFTRRSLNIPEGNLSTNHLKEIHRHLFQDVYEWAGEFRHFPTARETVPFCRPEYIQKETDNILKIIDVPAFKKLKIAEFVEKAGHIIGELNAVHPFLDGNGRVIRIYAQQISQAAGFKLDISKLKGKEWNEASRIAFLSANNKPLSDILIRHITHMS